MRIVSVGRKTPFARKGPSYLEGFQQTYSAFDTSKEAIPVKTRQHFPDEIRRNIFCFLVDWFRLRHSLLVLVYVSRWWILVEVQSQIWDFSSFPAFPTRSDELEANMWTPPPNPLSLEPFPHSSIPIKVT